MNDKPIPPGSYIVKVVYADHKGLVGLEVTDVDYTGYKLVAQNKQLPRFTAEIIQISEHPSFATENYKVTKLQ